MEMLALLLSAIMLASTAQAQLFAPATKEGVHYFRFMDIKRPQFSTLSLFNMSDFSPYGALADAALITHSTADGTLVPAKLQGILPPAAWVPLQVGIGGSLANRVILHFGTSYNVGSALATSVIKVSGLSTSPTAVAIRNLLSQGLDIGSGELGFFAGVGFAGELVKDGHFQSVAGMFPGRGIGPILQGASKYSLGLIFKPK